MRGILCLRMRVPSFNTKFFTSLSSLAPLQLPSKMETHLWYASHDDITDKLVNQYSGLLSPPEKEHVMRMHTYELRRGALLSRALVRTIIARCVYGSDNQVNPRSLKFRKNIHGKPELEWPENNDWNPPELHFNISHSSSLVACGVTIDCPIGIDVEDKERKIKHDIMAFAQRYFSQQEKKLLKSISDPELQRLEFLKLWTFKEAYVKALGRGFSGAPFRTFTIQSIPNKGGIHPCTKSKSEASEIVVEPLEDPASHARDWQFSLWELAGSHYAAICTKKDPAISGKRTMKVWKTIPLVSDEYVSGTDSVLAVGTLM
ncbi:L-aminoadipate-semialdehyde dehydrogenase-phosphopantetheinyl transferase-like [Heracleum sosnowskyi]|uniref:holo-[acyl-carrier-protein] synthase n=1 Tax=Heracleum sosnowskyi TaxID=360622 RepID=A0AAD8IPX5_9APIA|nr:L-aminoadipate-semialdehyde dehydrogenase-phosphopantetheinyl transferase-like [Heracleum sosnowskyi]